MMILPGIYVLGFVPEIVGSIVIVYFVLGADFLFLNKLVLTLFYYVEHDCSTSNMLSFVPEIVGSILIVHISLAAYFSIYLFFILTEC